jgi:hypothetical protein
MKNHEIKNLGDPTTDNSAVSKGWFSSEAQHLAPKTGFTMLGDITMRNNRITCLPSPTSDTDAVNRKWVDDEIVKQVAVSLQPTVSQ